MPVRRVLPLVIFALVSAARCREQRTGLDFPAPRANACGDSAAIALAPPAPRQGALFRVRVSGVPVEAALSGTVAGEALHFGSVAEPRAADSFAAGSFAAVPIDAGDSLGVEVYCTAAERTDTIRVPLAPTSGECPVERLTVAPAFGKEPDSALAARIRRESDRATAVAM